MAFRVVDQCLTTCKPRTRTRHVDLRVRRRPAKSVSMSPHPATGNAKHILGARSGIVSTWRGPPNPWLRGPPPSGSTA
eukprot:7366731-Alexandrium_andersonii.AAC.1